MSKEIFKPKYQWIRTKDICPAQDQKVLIVRDIGNGGGAIDRLIVETAIFGGHFDFYNADGIQIKGDTVLYWSVFPYSLEREVYRRKAEK